MRLKLHSLLPGLALLLFIVYANGAVPEDLSNYQNEHACKPTVRLVRPLSVVDVRKAVLRHARVVPVGNGHTYNKEFFCAPPPSDKKKTTANIVMTTIRPLTIDIDEEEMSVWVSAGVPVWDLMTYLASYLTPSAPRGYALGATPFDVNQTIAGAISTNAHGSSIQHSSLSNQALGFKVVLANGSLAEIYPENHPLYFRAFQVSVGRLGVVTDVKMRIVKETLVKRTLRSNVKRSDLFLQLREAQNMYRLTRTLPEWLYNGFSFFLNPLDYTFSTVTLEPVGESQLPKKNKTSPERVVSKTRAGLEAIDIRLNEPLELSRSEKRGSIADGVAWKNSTPLEPNVLYRDINNLPQLVEAADQSLLQFLGNATLESHEAALDLPPEALAVDHLTLADEYEVAVYVDQMEGCLQSVVNFLETETPEHGLRSFPFFRFQGKEEGLLSMSYDKPVLLISLKEYLYYNQEPRSANLQFRKLMTFLLTDDSCAPARLHWGKAGWPDDGCWNGADYFRENWCDFGCAVHALDPNGKFTGSAPGVWNWDGANLDKCCTGEGYDTNLGGCLCSVVPTRYPEDCPEAPFYTRR